MTEAEIVDLTVICQSFPETPRPQILRDNMLDTIDTMLEGDTELVVVEGVEGVGKTTLLAQFARRHAHHSLSLFIRPVSRWAYDPGLLRLDLCSQLQWVLYQETQVEMEDADDQFLRDRLHKLRTRARLSGQVFYFLVDGLHDIPDEDAHVRELVLDMLPFWLVGFRFLVTGTLEQLPPRIRQRVLNKSFTLSALTLDETERYLGDLVTDRDSLTEIHHACRGIPGHLASVRRILQSGVDVPTLLGEMLGLRNSFEIEWRAMAEDDDRLQALLAVLAYDRKRHTIEDLARMLNLGIDAVADHLRNLTFISVDPHTCEVGFVSEAFRRFASDKLQHLKGQTTSLLIDDLLRDPVSETALMYLPTYFEQSGRFEDLLSYLSAENISYMLEHSRSLSPIQRMADLGIGTALKLRRYGDLMCFSVQKSAVAELSGAEVWRSEVEARIALNDYDSALALAQSTVLVEDRLHLLAVVARKRRDQGLSPEPELAEQIRHLYDQVDPAALGGRAVDIASDLIHTNPDLAIELVERATQSDTGDSALDWALTKLSIEALSAGKEQPLPVDTIEGIRERIQDPKARRFSTGVSLLLGEYSASEVIAEAEKLDSAMDRIYLLRQWAMENRERDDAGELVDYALDLVVKTTEYPPNARDLREIATPLPFILDDSKARQLAARFDSHKGGIERLGPTEDYVRLQLMLAQTQAKYDFDAACNRLIDVLLYVRELNDLATRVVCLARLIASIIEIDPDVRLEEEGGFHSLVQTDLKSSIEQLLSTTACHYHSTRGVIRALAKAKPDMALDLAMALNTESRRDQALSDLIKSVIQLPLNRLDLGFVARAVDSFANQQLKDETLLQVIAALHVASDVPESAVEEVLPLLGQTDEIRDAGLRCNAYCIAIGFLADHGGGKYDGLISHFLDRLNTSWQAIDVGWSRIDIGFGIAESLSGYSLETARHYLALTEQFRDEVTLDSSTAAFACLACLRLAIRAYSGLLPRNLDTSGDFEALEGLIGHIPSSGERAGLWAELALRYELDGRVDDSKRVVAEYVRPLLQDIRSDTDYWVKVVTVTAPALYCAHPPTALEQISTLPLPDRDEAYANICEFILCKCPPSDPYSAVQGQAYDITYEEIVDICDLLSRMDLDRMICGFIECIANSLVSSRGRSQFSRQQRVDIAERLERVIEDRLPNPRHIKHDGYKIVAQAQVARIRRAMAATWMELIRRTREIPNLSDRAYVLCTIGAAMPNREAAKRREILQEAMQLTKAIPAAFDMIERYGDLASVLLSVDPQLSRACLQLAMKSAVETDRPEQYPTQRRIIDLAYRLDPDFAASLASLADDDPARVRARMNLRRQLQILDLKDRMAQQMASANDLTQQARSRLAVAAWRFLGALNAGRVVHVHFDYAQNLIQSAAKMPLSQSYPVQALVIENARKRFAKTNRANTYLRPLYEAILKGTNITLRLAVRSSIQVSRIARRASRSRDRHSVLIRAGDREAAIRFLREWFEDEVQDYLKICDPFFGPDDLEVLQLLRSANPACTVQILTSRKHHYQQKIPTPWEESYRTHWRIQISDQDPPSTEVAIVGTKSGGELPIHDRWWLTSGGGIRIGTSFAPLGLTRDSEISILTPEEAEIREQEVDQYLRRVRREHNREKLLYTLFTL